MPMGEHRVDSSSAAEGICSNGSGVDCVAMVWVMGVWGWVISSWAVLTWAILNWKMPFMI